MIRILIGIFISTLFIQGLNAQNRLSLFECSIEINKAELNILECDYAKAYLSYKKAFESSEFEPFLVDILSAMKCNLLSSDTLLNQLFLHKLSKKNISANSVLREFIDYKLTETNIERISNCCNFNPETKSTQFLKQLIIDDQAIRRKRIKIRKSDKYKRDSVDHVNFKKFKTYIEDNGFPSENNTAINIGEYKYHDVINILLRHFTQIGKLGEIRDNLKMAVSRFELHPAIYANMIETNNANPNYTKLEDLYNSFVLSVGKDQYYKLTNDLDFDRINKNRIEIGLDSLHISQRKFICINMNYFIHDKRIKSLAIEPYINVDVLPSFLFKNNPIQNRKMDDYAYRSLKCSCLAKK